LNSEIRIDDFAIKNCAKNAETNNVKTRFRNFYLILLSNNNVLRKLYDYFKITFIENNLIIKYNFKK